MLIWSLSSSYTILYNFIHLNINLLEITGLQVNRKIKTAREKYPEFLCALLIHRTFPVHTHSSTPSFHLSIEVPLPLNVTHISRTFNLFLPCFLCFSTSFSLPSTEPMLSYLKNLMHINTQTHKNAACWGNPMTLPIKYFCYVFLKSKTIFASIADP